MVTNFAEISHNPKGIKFLMDLPADAFTSIASADNLYITDESIVVKLVRDYLDCRKDLPLLDEENPKKDWSNLNEEEIKKRKEDETKAQEEENKKVEEAKKVALDEYNKLDELGKIQHDWNKKVEDIHTKATDRLAIKRLTKEEKKELFRSIRYSFLHHEELLKLAADPQFELAKDFIVEGLTYKLDQKDKNVLGEKLKINVHPRVYYGGFDPKLAKGTSEDPNLNPNLNKLF